MLLTSYLNSKKTEDIIATITKEKPVKVCKHPTSDELFCLTQTKKNSDEVARQCNGVIIDHKGRIKTAGAPSLMSVENEINFDWCEFHAVDMPDGVLMTLYFDNYWKVKPLDSFGYGRVSESYNGSWIDLFWEISGDDLLGYLQQHHGNERLTMTFVMCTPHNIIVEKCVNPSIKLVSTSTHDRNAANEGRFSTTRSFGSRLNVDIPDYLEYYNESFSRSEAKRKAIATVGVWMDDRIQKNPCFKGFWLMDRHGRTVEILSPTYEILLKLKNKRAIKDVALVYMQHRLQNALMAVPAYSEIFSAIKESIESAFAYTLSKWEETSSIEDLKNFALSVKDHPFSWILFQMRKKHPEGSVDELKLIWNDKRHHLKIAEKIFGNSVFERTEI